MTATPHPTVKKQISSSGQFIPEPRSRSNRSIPLRWVVVLAQSALLTGGIASSEPSPAPPVAVPGSDVIAADIKKSEVFDGTGLCSNPRWKASKIDKRMIAWTGPKMSFLTLASHQDKFDDKVIKQMVAKLQVGWSVYEYVMRDKPLKGKRSMGMPAMVAIPRNTAVAIGQGWMGHEGIDVATFYQKGYDEAKKGNVEGYYFYEMGRNWFTGAVHQKFTLNSAFAVHMGAVAASYATRQTRSPNLAYLDKVKKAGVNFDQLIRYGPAAKKAGADFNVCYTEILIKLAGDDPIGWTRRYYHNLLTTRNHGGNLRVQALNWIVACCATSGRDVSSEFVATFHVPLSDRALARFKEIDWKNPYAINQFFGSDFNLKTHFKS